MAAEVEEAAQGEAEQSPPSPSPSREAEAAVASPLSSAVREKRGCGEMPVEMPVSPCKALRLEHATPTGKGRANCA